MTRRHLPAPSFVTGLPITLITWEDGGTSHREGHLSDTKVRAIRPGHEPVHVKHTTTDEDRLEGATLAHPYGGAVIIPDEHVEAARYIGRDEHAWAELMARF